MKVSRIIEDHKVDPLDDLLTIEVVDEPGHGGANHVYKIAGMAPSEGYMPVPELHLCFQNGPIAEAGVNGITQEVLSAICIDRLRSFQKGPYACRENALALTKLEEAQHWLHSRTRARMARGIEGTHEK